LEGGFEKFSDAASEEGEGAVECQGERIKTSVGNKRETAQGSVAK